MNNEHYTLIYDGTFEGFLTAVFEAYERKLKDNVSFQRAVELCTSGKTSDLFSKRVNIMTCSDRSGRVWSALAKKLESSDLKKLYAVFLSELEESERVLHGYIWLVFRNSFSIRGDYGHTDVLRVSQIAKMVGREVHRMHAFVRFRLTQDGIYFSTIEPDFNVIPLIGKHFKSRYADQKWVIYDIKRKYGIFYDLDKVDTVEMTLADDGGMRQKTSLVFDEEEEDFQKLWANYFRSTNIKSRKNMKLHLQHVPRRYWKYLSEKNPLNA